MNEPRFQCSSASRKFLNDSGRRDRHPPGPGFSALQRAENFSIVRAVGVVVEVAVSVLFSEPKISQYSPLRRHVSTSASFSALQRAENFSMPPVFARSGVMTQMFQCSSASRKFLNRTNTEERGRGLRAFQCSSASRKFLNIRRGRVGDAFGAFQCSSASRKFLNVTGKASVPKAIEVSVLFSEPKISQYRDRCAVAGKERVSVLFSEPKISQSSSTLRK